jgi:osmotically-inducible protein OsmY
VGVTVTKGLVTLAGTVERASERSWLAERVARVAGVAAVRNLLDCVFDDMATGLAGPYSTRRA